MGKILSSLLTLMLLTGCAAPFVLMVHPQTGTTVECSGVGVGVIRAVAVSNQVENCVAQYRGMGYVRADSLTPEQREAIKLAPPVREHRTVSEPQRPDHVIIVK